MTKFLQSIKEKAEHMNEVKELQLTDGVTIKYCPRFANTKIADLVTDLLNLVKYCEDNLKDKLPELDSQLNTIVNFLTVKHFTELKEEIKDCDYEEQLKLMYHLCDTYWFSEILLAFEDGELEKIKNAVENSIIIFNRLEELKVGKKTNGKKK